MYIPTVEQFSATVQLSTVHICSSITATTKSSDLYSQKKKAAIQFSFSEERKHGSTEELYREIQSLSCVQLTLSSFYNILICIFILHKHLMIITTSSLITPANNQKAIGRRSRKLYVLVLTQIYLYISLQQMTGSFSRS